MKTKRIFWAVLLILAGVICQGKNMGIIDYGLFRTLISWQMLLLVLGGYNLWLRNYVSGIILFFLGTVFILPKLSIFPNYGAEVFWPLTLVCIGVTILLKPVIRRKCCGRAMGTEKIDKIIGKAESNYDSTDGYVISENTLSSVQQIVLDPVFRGARIKNVLGGTVLDLRRTALKETQTFIDVECTFGGIEIYLPAGWNLLLQVRSVAGGCEDKRYNGLTVIDMEHTLVVRGTVNFGGIVFKS